MKAGTLRLRITCCLECILGNSDRDICMHPNSSPSYNPFSTGRKAPKRCPLRTVGLVIRLEKEKPARTKKWTRKKLTTLLRLHETEGMTHWVLGQHFEIAPSRVVQLLKEARYQRNRNWMGWSDKL